MPAGEAQPEVRREAEPNIKEIFGDIKENPRMRERIAASQDVVGLVRSYEQLKKTGESFQGDRDPIQVELEGLHGKKETLEKSRQDLAKRFEGFRESSEARTLEPLLEKFQGEKRELLLESLNRDLNPVGNEKEKWSEKSKSREEKNHDRKVDAVHGDFHDAIGTYLQQQVQAGKISTTQASQMSQNLPTATYLHLKQERVYKAEDQLNGTELQKINAQTDIKVAQRRMMYWMKSHPGFVDQLGTIVRDTNTNEQQKVRAVTVALDSLGVDREKDSPQEAHIQALKVNTPNLALIAERQQDLERRLHLDKESLEHARELAEANRSLDTLPN